MITFNNQYTAAALYDGGWRAADRKELIEEYDLTEEEANEFCNALEEMENEDEVEIEMNTNKLKTEFKAAVEEMKKNHAPGTYHWWLPDPIDDNNNWAIVLGWQDGYKADSNDSYMDGTWRICAKLAYQSKNNVMQCDYGIDFDMPYNEETGEVDDNEISIYSSTDTDEVVDWLLKCYNSYKEVV